MTDRINFTRIQLLVVCRKSWDKVPQRSLILFLKEFKYLILRAGDQLYKKQWKLRSLMIISLLKRWEKVSAMTASKFSTRVINLMIGLWLGLWMISHQQNKLRSSITSLLNPIHMMLLRSDSSTQNTEIIMPNNKANKLKKNSLIIWNKSWSTRRSNFIKMRTTLRISWIQKIGNWWHLI